MKMFQIALGAHIALSSLALAVLAGPTFAQAPDTLRIRLNADIRSLDPGVNRDANTDILQGHLFEGLVAFKEDASVDPLLAERVDVSPDGKTYTFVLREGLRFSNGAALTSEDVLRTWQRYTDPATGWRCLPDVDGRGAVKVTEVTAKDDKTVVFTLDRPSALFLATLARPDCGGTGIYHQSSLGNDGKWKEPITTAPFKLGEWKRGEYIELLRNDAYVPRSGARDGLTGNKTALVPKVRFVVIPDESSTKAALLTGDIDIIFDVENADLPEYRTQSNILLDGLPIMGISSFLIQTNDPVMKDVRIRKAFLLSLDIAELVNAMTDGTSTPNNSPIPTPSSFHGPVQSQLVQHDVSAAKKLLAEAGYAGQPIKMIANKRYPAMFNSAIVAQSMAAEAGLNIELEIIDWGAQQDRYLNGNFQIMSYSYSPRLDPSLSFEMFSGVKAKEPRKVWENAQALELLAKSTQVSDAAQRQVYFDAMESLFRGDEPMIVTYSAVRTSGVRSNVEGFKGWALGQPRAWGVAFKQ